MKIASSTTRNQSLLNTDSSGIFGAYSLRDLNNNNQAVVRVRRSLDNTELDFTARQVINGSLLSWVGANNGFVRTLYDQSGGGRNVGNITSNNQPQIVSSGSLIFVNGRPGLQFNGSSQFLASPAIYSYRASDGIGLFCVYKKTVESNSDTFTTANPESLVFFTGDFLSVGGYYFRVLGGKIDLTRPNSAGNGYLTTRADTHSIDTQQMLSSAVGGSSIELYNQSVEVGYESSESGTSYSATGCALSIGIQVATNPRFFSGIMQEVIVYYADKSNQRIALEKNINNYYQIY